MSTVYMSGQYPEFIRAMEQLGHRVIPTKPFTTFHHPEQYHADMQLLKINDRLFSIENCRRKVGKKYPANVRLNCLYLGNRLYGNLDAVDDTVLDYCHENGIAPVHVNQGYTRCSTLVVNQNAVITADSSIENAMRQYGVDVLRIVHGHIRLDGYPYGFIGGCSATINDTIYFFGSVNHHPDSSRIQSFIASYHANIEILCRNHPLTDIGGVVVV
ncbi:MAG: hypothetical protein IJ598_02520 [Ruminococcus sp.]|nr:hypothetical protein [Ruminococcus sp.]